MLLKIQSSKTMQMKNRVTEARVHTHVKKNLILQKYLNKLSEMNLEITFKHDEGCQIWASFRVAEEV
jgi:hypothetical protein